MLFIGQHRLKYNAQFNKKCDNIKENVNALNTEKRLKMVYSYLSILVYQNYDIISELLTPDSKAIIAFVIGGIAGLIGTFIRFTLRYNKSKDGLPFFRDGDIYHYIGWPLFGSFAAMVINTFPFVSFLIGVFAPLFYKLLEEIIKSDPSRFIPFLKTKKD